MLTSGAGGVRERGTRRRGWGRGRGGGCIEEGGDVGGVEVGVRGGVEVGVGGGVDGMRMATGERAAAVR